MKVSLEPIHTKTGSRSAGYPRVLRNAADALVSVIIPFYNADGAFLRETIDSVTAQTYPHWELILVDDGSTESAAVELARSLADPSAGRIRLVSSDVPGNRGSSAARNEGLRHARGKYIAFLDADDCWYPNKLAMEVSVLEAATSAAMVYSSYLYWHSWTGDAVDRKRDWIPPLGVRSDRALLPPEFVLLCLRGTGAVPTPSATLFRKSALEQVGGFDESFPGLYDDQVLFSKIGLRYPVVPLERVTTRYRQHPHSLCARASSDSEWAARGRFLDWFSRPRVTTGKRHLRVAAVVVLERWKHRHPGLGRAGRFLRKLAFRGWNASPARPDVHGLGNDRSCEDMSIIRETHEV